jgi:hypothetical protein
MKKTIIIFSAALFIILSGSASFAKNYTLSTHARLVTKVDSNSDVLLIQLTNTTKSALSIRWVMLSNTVQNTPWAYTLCDLNTCFTTSSSIPNTATDLVDPSGGGAFNLTIHYNQKPGSGIIQIALWDVNEPSNQDTILFSVDATRLSVENNNFEGISLKLYPNPSSDYINIQQASNTGFIPAKAIITNAQGQIVQTASLIGLSDAHLPVHNLPQGVYYLSLKDASGRETICRFVKE